jgi:hypothetical protein
MNDDDVITAVREQRDRVHSPTAVEQIIGRGRAVRTRRRVSGVAGALAVVAASVLAVTALGGPSHQQSRPPTAHLAAWTVTAEPGGVVAVTIRDLRDAAGLQRALQARGVRATVRFHPSGGLASSCVTEVPSRLAAIEQRVFVQRTAISGGGARLLYIDPAAVPKADKIAIDAFAGNGLSLGLLTRDGRCPPGSGPGGIGMKATPAGH